MEQEITMIDNFSSDAAFDSLYSLRAQQLSSIHWTPIEVAKKAAAYLTGGPAGKNILDIGSGVGKFCIVGGHIFPDHIFHGVEQRKALIDEAIIAQNATNTPNVHFIHANFNELDMDKYDHIYFYNSFSENLFHYKPIDNLIDCSEAIYNEYLSLFYEILEDKPSGTRVATFHCDDNYIPPSYKRVQHVTGESLKLWIKQ
ncbi:2-polyprenyl-3-methyl-5-hydroxy-6-metoxy-1,4-benzoquinol methylase [Pedobacter cryoconitis]|uniref:tRNA (guanine(46)-N(7))-methyltransferase n=1 Tax=Pedobacter cryoconitis TaxID=188932 RepID=A0A7W8ZM69_9SPHI|nr:class I SAM-dependent methyltransferase [Pedobacter cryoconitis]MBB5636582.1 2-polyprenyl-3-methyl-5-hydroxy-6-metoxy-1,4-benzoquinol methylase [Pedobacter cryoconitis]